jgi:hypothetical protein
MQTEKQLEREKRISAPWIMFEKWIMTNADACGRPLKKPKRKIIFQYYERFSMKFTSQSIAEKQFGLIYDKAQFGSPFRYLIKSMMTHGK